MINLLPATAVIVSEEGEVTMSDADTTVTPTQRKDSDLGITIFNKLSEQLHYVSMIMQL